MEKIEFAADLDTPVSAFLKLAPLQPVFLLESAEKNETVGRYSFIGILPRQYFVLEKAEKAGEFFSALDDVRRSLPAWPWSRFGMGLVGFFSYPVAALLHPKVSIRQTGGEPLAAFVLPSAIVIFDHLKRTISFASLLTGSEEQALAADLRRCMKSAPVLPRSGRSSEPEPNLSANDFGDRVTRALEYIRAGDIFQVVLSVKFQGRTDADPFQMYRALRMINPSPYLFYLNFAGVCFFGSSPETMVRTAGAKVVLRPIAGTRPRGADAASDVKLEDELLKDEKERAEHLMLLDLARNDLGRLADPGSVEVTEFAKVERYSHVMHLVSTVEAKVSNPIGIRQLFSAVFPAGTVSGAPKVRAMQIIDELEPHSRGLYAGSVGYISATGDVDHCIAIRSVQRNDGQYVFTVGAGIVADSRPDREYQEISNKAGALRNMLNAAGEAL